jgi:hypothetical protein
MIDTSLININKNIKKNKETQKRQEKETKICKYDIFLMNEIKVCNKIKNIPYYSNEFNIITDNNFIQIGEMRENRINISHINNTLQNKYVLCKYLYSYEKCILFNDFFYSLPTKKLIIFHILDSYIILLNSLIKLRENNICFFDISFKNVIFNNNFKPILQNFKKSIISNKNIDESYILKVIEKIKENEEIMYKPIEVYILFYIIQNNEETMTYSLMELICDKFMQNNQIIHFLQNSTKRETYNNYKYNNKKYNNYKYKYTSENDKNICYNILKKYVNKSKSDIIRDIIRYYDTWGLYEINALYINTINNVFANFSLNETFISKFILFLIQTNHLNPLKRETVEDTLNNYNILFNSNTSPFL